jgi:group I intron endonuclease
MGKTSKSAAAEGKIRNSNDHTENHMSICPTISKFAAVFDPSIQKWADVPPGQDHGVVYAACNKINGKGYVGIHGRGKRPISVRSSRWSMHESSRSNCRALKHAIAKYGADEFEWFIVEYVRDDVLGDREQHWIDSLQTRVPSGYNLTAGGKHGELHTDTVRRMKETRNKPVYIESLRKRRKDEWKNPADAQRFTDAMTKGKRTTEFRERRRELTKKQLNTRTPEEVEQWAQRMKATCAAKREKQLLECTTEAEQHSLLKKFALVDQQKEYQRKVKAQEIVPQKRRKVLPPRVEGV